MLRDLDRLEDILTAADDIADLCRALTQEELIANKPVRYAILHALTIIGEAASRISEDLRLRHPSVPWRRIIAFRHRVVHGYGELDLILVWEVARNLVPTLRDQVTQIRAEFPEDPMEL